jgi:hypothetical protein
VSVSPKRSKDLFLTALASPRFASRRFGVSLRHLSTPPTAPHRKTSINPYSTLSIFTMSSKPVTTFWRLAGMSYLQVRYVTLRYELMNEWNSTTLNCIIRQETGLHRIATRPRQAFPELSLTASCRTRSTRTNRRRSIHRRLVFGLCFLCVCMPCLAAGCNEYV